MFAYKTFKFPVIGIKSFVRCKHKPDHWSVLRKKTFPIDKALEHFDEFYKQVFHSQWAIIREGLLNKQKYVAVVNNFSDTDRIISALEIHGALNIRKLFMLEKQYLEERLQNNKRISKLQKIWKLDKKISKDEQYKSSEDTEKNTEKPESTNLSLKKALESAEYDHNRLINLTNVADAEILHEFIPATKIKGKEDFVSESSYYQYYDRSSDFPVHVKKEYDIHFPEHLNVYCFEESNHTEFAPAKRGTTGVLDYYLMDGASLLPVLALDLRPGVKVLDMCAAPGGKSLLSIQSLYPEYVVCNDSSSSRVKRIFNVMDQFLYDFNERWISTGKIKVTKSDARFYKNENFDRILVDVPCTTDRHALHENDNNIFKPSRIKERLQLPELQCELLQQALKMVRIGGIVVYSTCSLSPIQNDGVVHMALRKIWEETKLSFEIKDLSPALVQANKVFKFAGRKVMKYGHLVLPDVNQNYGPMYFCKIERTS